MPGFNFIDLFAGAGGFSLGMLRAGGRRHWVVESDSACLKTIGLNFTGATALGGDVRQTDFTHVDADVVIAGPPCQGFSALNKNVSADPRNDLYLQILRCVDETSPSVVVVENVARFRQSTEGVRLVQGLTHRGYAVRHGVVDLADYGVPQRRSRTLVVAAREGLSVPWPHASHALKPSEQLRRHRTVGDALALLPFEPDGKNWHRPYASRPTYAPRYQAIPYGGSRRDLPPDLVLECWKTARGFMDVMGRLEWDRPSVTIRTQFFRPEKGRFLHPVADRPITPREAARLQSFPDSFRFPEDLGVQTVARQIGNAMPPRAALAIGEAVRDCLSPGRYETDVERTA